MGAMAGSARLNHLGGKRAVHNSNAVIIGVRKRERRDTPKPHE